MQSAPGGVPMVAPTSPTPPPPSLMLLTGAERDAIGFANGVLVELAGQRSRWPDSVAEVFTENANVLRSLLDRMCR